MDKFLRLSIIFLATYLLLTILFPHNPEQKPTDNISIEMNTDVVVEGNLFSFSLTNNTDQPIFLGKGTPPEFVHIERHENGEWIPLIISANEPTETTLQPKEKKEFSFSAHNIALFTTPDNYRIRVVQYQKEFTKPFEVAEAGFFRTIWRTFFWKPLYNGMIGSLELTYKDLGWAIILLTLIVKLLLFIPTKNGMEAQKKMQAIQPELDKLKAKYGSDTQKLATETMGLYKKHNIRPFASIMPILLQLPVLIGLYYVIMEGLYPHNHYFLYPFLQHFSFDGIQTTFLNIIPLLAHPIDSIGLYWIPPVIGIAQFFAMKMSFASIKKKASNSKKPPEGFMAEFQNEMQKMNGVLTYVLPVIVMVTTFIMPVAVGLYWFVSTIFGIWQQWMVNQEK